MAKNINKTMRTKKHLTHSFWELYKKEDPNKITIESISKVANINRTTFYRYFSDITDILNKLEDDIIDNIKQEMTGKSAKSPQIFNKNFRYFTKKYGEYIAYFNEKGNKSFYNKFKSLIKNDVFDYLNFNIKEEKQKEFVFEFMFSSLINSYTYWYKNQKMMRLDAFVDFANGILLNGTKSIINYQK